THARYESAKSEFAGGVGGGKRHGRKGPNGDVCKQDTATRFDEIGQHGARAMHASEQIDLHHPAMAGPVAGDGWPDEAGAGIIDPNVDPAKSLGGPSGEGD